MPSGQFQFTQSEERHDRVPRRKPFANQASFCADQPVAEQLSIRIEHRDQSPRRESVQFGEVGGQDS